MNHFALLSLPQTFSLDLATLESAYFAAQRQYHPDRFVNKTAEEKLVAAQQSMDINRAYETLKNPLKRAQYLLSLQGIRVGTDKDSVKPSQVLLMEIMELREEPPAKAALETLRQESITRNAQYFEKQNWQAMAEETLRLGYLMKI